MKDRRSARQRREINQLLGAHGFGQLDDRGLIPQLAYCVRDHDHFRDLLKVCDPLERKNMYESLRPYLRFQAKPLDVYIAEAGAEAERRQLPRWDSASQTFSEFKVPEVSTTLAEHAERAIHNQDCWEKTKHSLVLTCAKCTFTQEFFGETLVAAALEARKAGWVYDELEGKPREICPKCPASRRVPAGNA